MREDRAMLPSELSPMLRVSETLPPDLWRAASAPAPWSLPLDVVKVSAGFPSPAADYEEQRLDIHDYLIRNPTSTFYFPVEGTSMQGAGIFDGDILVVDKSVEPRHGHIVIAFVDGERLVKRLCIEGGRVSLVAENPAYPTLTIREGNDLEIWGVVIGRFRKML